MRIIRQPEGSSLCGQCCVAMAAGVSLDRACQAVGHRNATTTKNIILALAQLGIPCASRMKRVSRNRPTLPARCLVAIHGPAYKPRRWHWLLQWDGKMLDPGGCWPDYYKDWKITSYLEIL